MGTYFAMVRKDPESDYGVDFPDFPGCVTAGGSLDEARAMANEALALHIEGMMEDGDLVPMPSSLNEIMADPHNTGAIVIEIAIPTHFRQVTR